MFVPYLGGAGAAGQAVGAPTKIGSPTNFMMPQAQMFVNIEINIFVPRDPYILNQEFRLQDVIEDSIEKLERV